LQQWLRTKELTDGHPRPACSSSVSMHNDLIVLAVTRHHAPVMYSHSLLPVIYYKYVAQIAETIIDFWKSKTRMIKIFENRKNENHLQA